jgi:hypothetical protein
VVLHLRQFRRCECADDGTAGDEQRDHGESMIRPICSEMQCRRLRLMKFSS